MNDADYAEIRRKLNRADQAISDLCAGRRRWTMSVPADPDRDQDLVLGEAIRIARDLLALVEEKEKVPA